MTGGRPACRTPTPPPARYPKTKGILLVDWGRFLVAALDGYDAVAVGGDRYLAAAQNAADVLLQRFLDGPNGGFWDIEDNPERLGYLRAREKPLADNVCAAMGLMRLHHATLESRYQQTARHALSAYVDANRDYGELAADYAVAVDRYLNPVVEVTVEGQPGPTRHRRHACRRAFIVRSSSADQTRRSVSTETRRPRLTSASTRSAIHP